MINDDELRLVLSEVNAVLYGGGQSKAVQAMALLLKAQRPGGCWENSGNPSCEAIQTTQAIDTLLTIGNEGWLHNSNSPIWSAAGWLCNTQHRVGKWGQDAFDTAEVLRVLLQFRRALRARGLDDTTLDKPISRGLEYLRRQCSSSPKFGENRGRGWYGPAFWASAAVVFYLLDEMQLVNELVEEIWSFRQDIPDTGDPEGGCAYFECPDQVRDENLRIWNTAQTIIGLTRLADRGPTKSHLAPFVRWLGYRQNCAQPQEARTYGSWGNDAAQVGGDSLYICAYSAVVAIHRAQGPKAQIDLGVAWFDRQIHEANEERILGNTALCAAAAMYAEVLGGKRFMPSLPLDAVLRLIETAEGQAQKIQELNTEISEQQLKYAESESRLSAERDSLMSERDRLQSELNAYVIKVRKEGLGIWALLGLLIGIAGIVLAIVVPLF